MHSYESMKKQFGENINEINYVPFLGVDLIVSTEKSGEWETKPCLTFKVSQGCKFKKKYPFFERIRVFFRVLNIDNVSGIQVELGRVKKNRLIRFLNTSEVKIQSPTFNCIRGTTLIVSCTDVHLRPTTVKYLQSVYYW